jgi:molybdenum cofactor cytidylyltransferase
MRFEEIQTSKAAGWSLAHSIDLNGNRLSKNTLLTDDIITALVAAKITTVLAYILEENDLDENSAAHRIALSAAGENISVNYAARGRANLYAKKAGLFIPYEKFNAVNSLSGDIGISCLPSHTVAHEGTLLGTVKIIPYGLPENIVRRAEALGENMEVRAFQAFNASLIMSGAGMTEKALSVTQQRLQALSGNIVDRLTCEHTVASLSKALTKASEPLILISGISAISDVRDTVPAALKAAGGEIIHLGMPVDPGNLLMLGKLGEKTVIGLPGCAKSPALNGFDWVLERYAAGLPLTAEIITSMGIGGLLKEQSDRPSPRAPRKPLAKGNSTAIVLAAGRSSRSGQNHKLLAMLDGKSVVEQTVLSLQNAGINDILVVTGARSDEIVAALNSRQINHLHNADYQKGMGSSLAAGIRAQAASAEQCLIVLADMPFVSADTYNALITAAESVSEAEIFAPYFKGKRGNPILWRKSQFPALSAISGDKGGRVVLKERPELVCDVAVDDPGVLIDLDTPEALAQFGIKVTS